MRLVKTLIHLTLAFQLTEANATGSEINENIHTVIKNNVTPLFRSMYLLKNTDKKLDQSDENTRQLVIALLLQKPNIKSILQNKSINLNAPAIIDSCKLRIGLQTEERYDLFCTTAYTPARALIELTLTPLQATCLTGDLAAMKVLINAGANIDGGPEELSPLTSCLATKRINQVDFLIDQGADVRVINSPHSLLSLISRVFSDDSDHAEAERLAEKVISKGADPHYFNSSYGNFGEIEMATRAGNLAIVKLLVTHGVDINKKSTEGFTPLALAEKNSQTSIVKFLESKGAKR
jgi:Ankyrin repeats (many copies)